jgi:hypothetical protein
MNAVYVAPFYLLKINFNVILPYACSSWKWMKVNSMRVVLINALHCLKDWNNLTYCEETDEKADARAADLGRVTASI